MAITLVGEVVNSCDAVTGFNQGNISTDDDNVEGTGAIGLKATAGTTEIYTTSLGATAPYSFASGGGEFGHHTIMWFNTKTPINANTGLQVVVGNGTDRGRWIVTPRGFYKGGFVTALVDSARAFDFISAGTWTTGGNPAQLSNITEVGGAFVTTTSIMGNFNNIQLDQMTVGLGVRADGGTVGSPNSFESVRAQDEDTSFWGWWSSAAGAFLGKGKLFVGPETGTATSVFSDLAFTVIFADERVASNFYEISTRGANTDVTFELGNISSANPTDARWNLTIDSTTKSFTEINSVYSGFGTFSLNANTTFTGTTLINGTLINQNGASLTGVTIINANTTDGTAFIISDGPDGISNCSFNFSDGHAIEITTPGTYNFIGNAFSGYGANDSNDAAIYNNSGGAVTLNISGGGDTPTVRNGASASTVINNNVSVTLTGMRDNTEVRVFADGTTTELAGVESATDGTTNNRSFTFSLGAGTIVDIVVLNVQYENESILDFEVPTADASIPIQQRFDRNYRNP